MTIDASGIAADVVQVDAAQSDVDGAPDAFLASLDLLGTDSIGLSARARGLIAAGLCVRAFLLNRFEDLRQRIPVGRDCWLVLESGLYGLKS